jgi:hypothetical protein
LRRQKTDARTVIGALAPGQPGRRVKEPPDGRVQRSEEVVQRKGDDHIVALIGNFIIPK